MVSMIQATVISVTDHPTEQDALTFCSLLDFEHQRCLQSGRPFHVLVCRLSTTDGTQFPMNESVKKALMSAVRESLHKTDHQGWFLQDLVLGTVLLSLDPRPSTVSSNSEACRIRRLIESRLSVVHSSLVLQFYEYLDLPPVQQWDEEDTTDRTLATLH
jgi:hypothetical protein